MPNKSQIGKRRSFDDTLKIFRYTYIYLEFSIFTKTSLFFVLVLKKNHLLNHKNLTTNSKSLMFFFYSPLEQFTITVFFPLFFGPLDFSFSNSSLLSLCCFLTIYFLLSFSISHSTIPN